MDLRLKKTGPGRAPPQPGPPKGTKCGPCRWLLPTRILDLPLKESFPGPEGQEGPEVSEHKEEVAHGFTRMFKTKNNLLLFQINP